MMFVRMQLEKIETIFAEDGDVGKDRFTFTLTTDHTTDQSTAEREGYQRF